MKGLLLKDWLTIQKQTKIYLVMMLIFLLIPSMFWYSIFVGSLVPVTVFAYDERSGWDKLARVMPYTSKEVVASKYIFGYLLIGGSAILGVAIQWLYSALRILPFSLQDVWRGYVILVCSAFIVVAVNMPVMFWLGVEKMRIFLTFFSIAVMMTMGTFISFQLEDGNINFPLSSGMILVILGISLVLQFISVKISEICYRHNMK